MGIHRFGNRKSRRESDGKGGGGEGGGATVGGGKVVAVIEKMEKLTNFQEMTSVGLAPTSGLRESSSHSFGIDRLPEEMNDMTIRDDKEIEAAIVDGNGTETGQIVTTIGGRHGQPKQTISYMAERVVGQGSFGVVFQIFRALSYIHHTIGVCHRDIKPQNLLVKQEPNISYICSRYYRAPELIFGATEYTTAIDIWSAGCVLAELLLGQPLFPGESGVDQLVKIIKQPLNLWLPFDALLCTSAFCLGYSYQGEIKCMNPNYNEFKFPQIKAHPWHKIFHKRMPPEAVDLVSRLLQYSPNLRCTALDALAHTFFDELRDPNTRLPNGRVFPPLFNFKAHELKGVSAETPLKLVPEHARKQCPSLCL
ncbi:hypothetical protein RND71_042265 [Anisodus tanguticus]|uniref:Protein kinase domain-containing protein n=1 Tax=Anisodus tanguticus TaxID=243964 RepID=A0AAE1UMV1_9SOLA|nr:hypothetical protein RND71_042265 [Anisodus tanguticus]